MSVKMYHVLNVVTAAATVWDLADCLLCGLSLVFKDGGIRPVHLPYTFGCCAAGIIKLKKLYVLLPNLSFCLISLVLDCVGSVQG
jgi:hypothetical protein